MEPDKPFEILNFTETIVEGKGYENFNKYSINTR